MRYLFGCISLFLLLNLQCMAQIKISEVMFNPVGAESSDEFIEIYNPSPRPFDLSDILIGDQTAQEYLVVEDGDSLLAPGQFAVIFDQNYDFISGNYANFIPSDALIFHVADNTLGSGGLSNSTPETILIISASLDTLDEYMYSIDNEAGYSDECIEYSEISDTNQWGNSLTLNGTPGSINSISPKLFELKIAIITFYSDTQFLRTGEDIHAVIHLENTGKRVLNQVSISFRVNGELIASSEMGKFDVGQANDYSFSWQAASPGATHAIFSARTDEVSVETDTVLFVDYQEQSLMINEIMYAPVSGTPEWIELFCPSDTISLNRWQLRDASGRLGLFDFDANVKISQGEYVLITSDSLLRSFYYIPSDVQVLVPRGFPALNNTDETLALLSSGGAPVDSVAIQLPAQRGRSIERINCGEMGTIDANWNYCSDEEGATPGFINSIAIRDYDLAVDSAGLIIKTDLLKRDQLVELEIPIVNLGRNPIELKDWQLRDITFNTMIADVSLSKLIPAGVKERISIDWYPGFSGEHTLKFNCTARSEQQLSNNHAEFDIYIGYVDKDIVINEIMAKPKDGKPEWIELINRTERSIDLAGWGIIDGSTTADIIPLEQEFVIGPGEYFIIAEFLDSDCFCDKAFIPDRWPSLNNSSDAFFLYDGSEAIIDSVSYEFSTSSLLGNSLELYNYAISGSTQAEWGVSASPEGSTPCLKNSLFVENFPLKGAFEFKPNPFSPDGDGVDDVVLIKYKLPLHESSVNLIIFDLRGKEVRRLLNNAHSGAERGLYWDGRDDAGRLLNIGIYIVYLEAIQAGNGKKIQMHESLVLAKQL